MGPFLHLAVALTRVTQTQLTWILVTADHLCRENPKSPSPTAWPYPVFSRPQSFSNASLALLRTCRQAYSEARLLPYQTNCFRFSFLDTCLAFSYCVRTTSFASVRHLHIYWQIFWPLAKDRTPNPALGIQAYTDSVWFQGCEIYQFQTDETWLTFWDMVSEKMLALEELRLMLVFPGGESSANSFLFVHSVMIRGWK